VISLLLLGALASPVRAAEIVIEPTAGPPGTVVQLRASGLTPMTPYLVQLVAGRDNINTVRLTETTVTTNAGGELTASLTVQQPAGLYSIRVVAIGGTVIASAPLTITGASGGPLPALPRTGGGGLTIPAELRRPRMDDVALSPGHGHLTE
jgi:hypothetical protein